MSFSAWMNRSITRISRGWDASRAWARIRSASSPVISRMSSRPASQVRASSSARAWPVTSRANTAGSRPSRISRSIISSARAASPWISASAKSNRNMRSEAPSTSRTSGAVRFPPP